MQAANSPGAQNVIVQEAPQVGESPQQATDQVVNIVNPHGNGTFTPFELPPRPPAVIYTYQSGLCLHPKSNYENDVCRGFLNGIAVAQLTE